MRVLLIMTSSPHYAGTGFAEAWTAALERQGCEVDRLDGIPSRWALDGPPADHWDVVVPHVLVEEVAAFAPTMQLASLLEVAGVPLLNSLAAFVVSADKRATHAVWAANNLPQPRTFGLEYLDAWPLEGQAMVLKPSLGDGARHLKLIGSLEDARAVETTWREDECRGGERRGPALLQEWIAEPACARLYATPQRTSLAYEKARHRGALITHGTVYERAYEPPPAMADLARRMVKALGGGLMGVDVLTDAEGRMWALEANAPFGFDVTDAAQGDFVASVAVEAAKRAGASRSVPARTADASVRVSSPTAGTFSSVSARA